MQLSSLRTLGRSGLPVSPLALGTMTFGNKGWGSPDDVSRSIFDAYFDAGGNFVDTADVYGGGRSEELVGSFITERKLRDQVVLATKFSFSGGNGRKNLHRAIEGSLRRLGTDYIDLYWVHVWDAVTSILSFKSKLTGAFSMEPKWRGGPRGGAVIHRLLRYNNCTMEVSQRRLLVGLLAAFIFCGAAFGRSSGGVDLAGKPVDPLRADAGKVTVLIFVRTDCPISNRYAPFIQKLSSEYAGKSVFWLVFPAKSENPGSITQYMTEYGYRISAIRDPEQSLVKLSHAETTPEAAVFNASGELVYHGRIDNWYEDFGRARRTPTTHELSDAVSASVSGTRPAVSSARAVGCSIADLR